MAPRRGPLTRGSAANGLARRAIVGLQPTRADVILAGNAARRPIDASERMALGCPPATRDGEPMQGRWLRLGISAVMGVIAVLTTRALGIPGNGSWIVACWIPGAVAAIRQPSWTSFAACVTGIAITTILLVVAADQYPGLAWLVVACEAAILGHGFLASSVVGRAWRLRSLRDPRVVWGLTIAIGLVAAFVLIAQDLARNPP